MRHAKYLASINANRRPAAFVLRLLPLSIALTLGGCDSRMNTMKDTDLQDRMYECHAALSQNPGFAISCDNVRRECLRRRKEGKFLC